MIYAWALAWVAEDAYISFRYARNLVEGNGLVFNPEERVEGYTNFFWTLLLAPGIAFRAQPEHISLVLGLACTGGAFFFLWRLHRVLFADAVVPGALLALGLNYTWVSFSTSGMETSLLAMTLAGALYFAFRDRKTCNTAAAGAMLALAGMTRPDAVLLLPAMGVGFFLQRRSIREWMHFLGAFGVIYAPYFLWRWNYYGDLLPNTFYAKSGGLSYHEQGWVYLRQFFSRYSLWVFLPLPVVAVIRKRGADPLIATLAAFVVLYSYYVVRVGGDFMEGRFFIPVLPFLYLLYEWSMRQLAPRRSWIAVGIALLVLSSVADRERLPERTIVNGITDERTWQPVVHAWLLEGEVLRRNLPAGTVVATDAVGAFGWQSNLPIIDTLGLTDRTVAHFPVTRRSRPGHEKAAPLDYLRSRNTAIIRDGVGLYHSAFPAPDFVFAGNRYYVTSTDPKVVQGFAKARADFKESP